MWDSKQDQDKNTHLKLVLNKLNVMCDFTFGHLAQKNFSKNFQLTCGPCPSIWELIVKYDLIQN
jgi:hypothetical protein